jgi:hypothetical protein
MGLVALPFVANPAILAGHMGLVALPFVAHPPYWPAIWDW